MNPNFDPFNDRTAREIRNSLSTALISELARDQQGSVSRVVARWECQNLPPLYQDYISLTRERYARARMAIQSMGLEDPRCQAVVLWNAGLFFELHELLETIWHDAGGRERIALKGLIQAAGAYVHSLRGQLAAARGLAQRARQNLAIGKDHLDFITNLSQLLEKLEQPSQPPPRLYWSSACAAGGQPDPAGGRQDIRSR